MKKTFVMLAVSLAASLFATTAAAQTQKGCHVVVGTAVWNLIASPNDALGRVLGPTTGTLQGAVSAYLTSLAPQPDGSFIATSKETWSLAPGDLIFFDGKATFTPVAGAPVGTVLDTLTLTAASGTGRYANAYGTITVTGIGYNLFGPNAAPGATYFLVSYMGTICTK